LYPDQNRAGKFFGIKHAGESPREGHAVCIFEQQDKMREKLPELRKMIFNGALIQNFQGPLIKRWGTGNVY